MLVPALLAVLLGSAPVTHEVPLRELVEDLAEALGAVPIVSPSVDRTVSLDPARASGAALLAQLERDLGLSVRLENGRLLVWDPAREGRAEPDLLTLPLPRVRELPKRRDGRTYLFAGADSTLVTVTLPRPASAVELPGCGPVRVVALPVDPFDGERRLFFPDASTCRAGAPYIVTAARDAAGAVPLPIGRCAGRHAVLAGDPAAADPDRAVPDGPVPGRPFVLYARLLEVDAVRETVLAEPVVRFDAADELESTSRFVHAAPGGPARPADLWIGGALLSAEPGRIELALAVTFVLDATPPGGTRALVRMAHEQGVLAARPGETVRKTLSSTFGQGRSALVLEVTVEGDEAR